MRAWIARHHILLLALAVALVLVLAAYAFWPWHAQLITGESQQQAETPAGVELAAHNAQVQMLQSQLEEAARQIAMLRGQPPRTVVTTAPVAVPQVVEQQRQQSGADFAIVTDPARPGQQVDLHQVQQLPAGTPVVLNQYNVQAYSRRLIEATVYPGAAGVAAVDVAYMRRVRVFGATGYAGPAVSYDQDRAGGKVRVGIRMTITR